MAKHTFIGAVQHVFESEGGFADHPADPGGATNYGITHATLAAWRGRPVIKGDVRKLTKTEASAIYRARYWNAVNGEALPAGLDYAVFDFGVNSGPKRAVEFLQRIVRVPVDGVCGRLTVAAAKGRDTATLINELCDARLAFLRNLPTWRHFGKGWSNRVAKVRQRALEMASAIPRQPDNPGVSEAPERLGGGLAKIIAGLVAAAIAAFIAWMQLN